MNHQIFRGAKNVIFLRKTLLEERSRQHLHQRERGAGGVRVSHKRVGGSVKKKERKLDN
jgi:hypothetical protein